MSQHENRHWTYASLARKLLRMTATQTLPTSQLTDLVSGVRSAVSAHADWADTAALVAEQLRRQLPTPDVLSAEQRAGSPDHAREPHAARRA